MKKGKPNIEELLQKLNDITETMEQDNLNLSDAFKKYEEGMKLYKECMQILDGYELEVINIHENMEKEN